MPLSNESIVAVRIVGGLGNQLFQYSTARSLADRLGSELILDCSDSRDRSVELDQFNIRARLIGSRSEIRKTHLNLPGTLGRKISKAVQLALPPFIRIDNHTFKQWKEGPERQFDRRITALQGRIYLSGYWQSYRYFENDRDQICADLDLKRSVSSTSFRWKLRIRQSNSVCLHVRRGDYLLREAEFGQCKLPYYQNAMALLRSRTNRPTFFVFSDDLAWCRSNFNLDDVVFVDCHTPEQVTDELDLMRSCRHHIIANSTLSWWSAWLATASDQIVVAPQPWFTSGGPSYNDIILKEWIRLPRDD